jgi:DNA-binding response OmpR family regulator
VGGDDVLAKPFEMAELLRIVARYVPGKGSGSASTL